VKPVARSIALGWTLLCIPFCDAYGIEPLETAVHKEVRKALAWELPVSDCVRPTMPGVRQEVHDVQGTTIDYWDVDSYTFKRYQRKERRWQQCVDRYKDRLRKDFEWLRDSARYGLTKNQANVILGKMKVIQTVLMSPDGIVPAGSDSDSAARIE
jgi:hypothetical protein